MARPHHRRLQQCSASVTGSPSCVIQIIHHVTWMCRTLPSNLALCVNPDFDYARARDPASGRVYIVAAARLPEIPGAVPKAKKAKKGAAAEPPTGGWQVRPLDLQREESGLQVADAPKDVLSLPPWTSWPPLACMGVSAACHAW